MEEVAAIPWTLLANDCALDAVASPPPSSRFFAVSISAVCFSWTSESDGRRSPTMIPPIRPSCSSTEAGTRPIRRRFPNQHQPVTRFSQVKIPVWSARSVWSVVRRGAFPAWRSSSCTPRGRLGSCWELSDGRARERRAEGERTAWVSAQKQVKPTCDACLSVLNAQVEIVESLISITAADHSHPFAGDKKDTESEDTKSEATHGFWGDWLVAVRCLRIQRSILSVSKVGTGLLTSK